MDKKGLLEIRKLTITELEEYYAKLRKIDYDNNKHLTGIELRKKIHLLCLLIVKIDRILSKEKIKVIGDEREKTKRTRIYACTHIGGNDIQRAFEGIKEHAYLFIADLGEMYRNEYGLLLNANGYIPMYTKDKIDRSIAKNRAIEVLNNNANLLVFPEGAWNITPNLPVMKLYNGTVDMALRSDSIIIPMAEELIGNTTYINIGKNIDPSIRKGLSVKEITNDLRDNLASLKWKIWEDCQEITSRKNMNITLEEYQKDIVNILNFGEGYSIEDVERTRYIDDVDKEYKNVYKL